MIPIVVLIDTEMCDDCGMCVEFCPYGAPALIRKTGKAGKCDSCVALRTKGQQPACVEACLTRCLMFDDVDELKATYGDDLVSELPCTPEAFMTNPNILIKASGAEKSDSF